MAEKKIGEIKEELKAVDDEKLPSFIETYEKDERSGVVKIVEQAKKRFEKLEAEKLRIENLKKYEREYADYGYINDSKKLSAAKREELYDVIMEKAVAVGIGMASSQRIDEINILQATYEAMREAISKLSVKPDILLNDAVTIPGGSIRQVPIIKGDAKSISIGAASIVAKVTRDRLMVEYDKILPQYGFASNKGYGSAEHIKALQEVGPSPIHRASFIKNFV